MNYISNEHISSSNRPSKRSKEAEDTSRHQKLQISLNNFFQDDVDKSACIPNANVISTGLRLSYDDDERNSSVTSASENMSTLPVVLSLDDKLRTEIDSQEEELNRYIRVQVSISRILVLHKIKKYMMNISLHFYRSMVTYSFVFNRLYLYVEPVNVTTQICCFGPWQRVILHGICIPGADGYSFSYFYKLLLGEKT